MPVECGLAVGGDGDEIISLAMPNTRASHPSFGSQQLGGVARLHSPRAARPSARHDESRHTFSFSTERDSAILRGGAEQK